MGCSAQGEEGSGRRGGGNGSGSGAGSGTGGTNIVIGSGGSGPGIGGFTSGGSGPLEGCVETPAEAELTQEPVDIIMVIDTSGSMNDEAQAVEDNVSVNFSAILDESGVDYRVILIARHREGPRAESGPDSTAICIASPLGGGACPSANPTFGERFFHFNEKIESTTSFDFIISAYTGQDDSSPAASGYAQWLRPGAKKVFLEQTDDNAAMPVDAFLASLTAIAPQHFGSDPNNLTFVFHSITGLVQKTTPTDPYLPEEELVTGTCTGGNNSVANAGESYQILSQRTGGLRFPLCEFAGFDVVFRRIAEDVVTTTRVACDFPIPPAPEGRTLDLDMVAVNYTPGDGSGQVQYLQAPSCAECEANAFCIENERVNLCPETCALIQADAAAAVDVVFACESKIIVK